MKKGGERFVSVDKGWLSKKYWEEGLSQAEMATELGCGRSTVQRRMIESAIPIHLECANSPPKRVKKSYAVTEDYFAWDEEKGEAVKRKRNKSVTKRVKKRKIKEGDFEFDDKKGKFWKLKKQGEGKTEMMIRDKKVSINEATEEIEEEIREVVYKEEEFLM